jgi:hypothetical protein
MAREQLGAAPSGNNDATIKLYVDGGKPGTVTVTAAGITTLTSASTQTQIFTGSTTQTVRLPTTGVAVGTQYQIVNASTGVVTVQSSGANTIATVPATTSGLFTALVATPTTAANWQSVLVASVDGTQTLSNKTLSLPTLTNPRINGIADTNGATNIYIGTAQPLDVYGVGNNHAAHFQTNDTTTGSHAIWCHRVGSTGSLIGLYYSASVTLVGNITTNGSTTTYGTSSDYRLKENVEPLDSGIETIEALRPVKYNWKLTGLYGEGFLAHELQEVIPEAVSGEKDAVDTEGKISPQNIDLAKIVPHLVIAVQELKAELDAAKARIAQLEAGAQ